MTYFVIGAAKFCCTAMDDDLLRELREPNRAWPFAR